MESNSLPLAQRSDSGQNNSKPLFLSAYAKDIISVNLNAEICATIKQCLITMDFLRQYFSIKKHFYFNNERCLPTN